ncbi:FecR domain-containing protein [Pseudorhizobium halotolerans]|nr:FecR domain-containing protein [Pseudorhizobium halotolerans]
MSHFAYRILRVIALFLVFAGPTFAGAQDWTVTRANKQVSYTVDKKTWHAVETGSVIPNQAWISTGPRGRATLARGTESISLQPNTLGAVITTQGLFSRKTDVVQQKGQMALNIEKRSRPHTYIHTPFMAAVVKGTTFTVTVTEEDASLSVQEGLVQVSSFTGGQSTNVGPGQQVTVDQNQSMSVAGIIETPAVFSVEPTRASIAAVGQPAPVGAGLGLGTIGDQTSTGPSGEGGSHGVNGESSGGGDSAGNQSVIGNNGNGGGNGNGNGGGNGNGNNGNGHGNGGGNGNGNNGNGHGNDGGNGSGNNGNGHGNGGGNGNGNNGNGHGNGGGNGNGHEGKGPGGKGKSGKADD